MEIRFVTSDTLNTVWQEKFDTVSKSKLTVFGFNGLGLVSYKKELSGETEYFRDVATLSKQTDGVIICGCDTDTYGVFRHSAVIADRGKILGVSDMVHQIDSTEFVSGGNFRVYDTSVGKIGLIIADDIYFPEVVRVLSLCDADLIVSIMGKIENGMPQTMIKAGSFCNGVPIALCSKNYCAVSDIRGNIISAGSSDLTVTVKNEKDFRLISCRRRGLYKDFNSGY